MGEAKENWRERWCIRREGIKENEKKPPRALKILENEGESNREEYGTSSTKQKIEKEGHIFIPNWSYFHIRCSEIITLCSLTWVVIV